MFGRLPTAGRLHYNIFGSSIHILTIHELICEVGMIHELAVRRVNETIIFLNCFVIKTKDFS